LSTFSVLHPATVVLAWLSNVGNQHGRQTMRMKLTK